MTLELRELRGDDLFTMLGIIGKLDIKDEFVGIFKRNASITPVQPQDHLKKAPTKKEKEALELKKAQEEKAAEERGMEAMAGLLQKVLVNLGSIKTDLNRFLAELAGVSVTDIQELGLTEYSSLVIGFFKKPELTDFFKSIASLL
jgi:hypothetical protein